MGIAEVVVLLVWWVVPIAIVVYIFRALQTIVLGVRSINAGVERIASAVEELAEAERRRAS